jgi:hypothetical protein
VSGQEVYIRNDDGIEEVYDLANDPGQARNLVTAPAIVSRLDTFREALEQLTRDDARPLEWRSTVANRRQSGGKEIGPAKVMQ